MSRPANRPSKQTLLADIPADPGVYQMIDASETVIYIGKAKNLKKRVASYLGNRVDRDIKTQLMVSQIARIEPIVTQTEQDALILENQLIKAYRPRYNIALKDDKNYPYVKLTHQDYYPRFSVVRDKKEDGALYFGPFTSLGSSKQFERFLQSLFPVRDCSQKILPDRKAPKCIKLDLGKCLGPCVDKTVDQAYQDCVNELILFLSGKSRDLLKVLEKKMKTFSDQLMFEKAKDLRDKISRINRMHQHQVVQLKTQKNVHIWVQTKTAQVSYVLVQRIVEGKLLYQNGYYQSIKSDQSHDDFWTQCVISFYQDHPQKIDEIISDSDLAPIFQEIFEVSPLAKQFLVPKRGERVTLLKMAQQNARISAARVRNRPTGSTAKTKNDVRELASVCQLVHYPNHIVGMDISHLSGTKIVASAVSFRDGKPDKSGYRKYQIRSVVGGDSDDYQSMYELVLRFLSRCIESDTPLPDLLVIDGGKGQLSSAVRAVKELGLSDQLGLISIAKKEEQLFGTTWKGPLQLDRRHPALRLVQRIRDEAHRFALTYQRQKRRGDLSTQLESIKGLGPKRQKALLTQYGSVTEIARQPVDELAKVGYIGVKLAQEVLDQLKPS